MPDSAASIVSATATRHHLVFGRRGAGKTALLLEAKRQVEEQGELAVWMNLQPFRWSDIGTTSASIVQRILDAVEIYFQDHDRAPQVLSDAVSLNQTLTSRLARGKPPELRPLLPQIQRLLQRFTKSTGSRLYVFLDDFYFVPRVSQVELLDLLHASVRDSDVWLKVATIRHT